MSLTGSNISARYLPNFLKLGMLFAILLTVFLYLKKKIISSNPKEPENMSKASEVYSAIQLTSLNDTLSKFMLAQAGHETAGFTSSVFKSNNNCFGMKFAGQVNSIGDKNGYANYTDIFRSVADLVAWYTRKRSSILSLPLYINTLESYVKFLKNNSYFEASEAEYLKGCQYFYNLYFNE